MDEAHRFVNRGAERTRLLFNNMADYVLLFTATPISRGSEDLLSLVDLLGADNFDDDVLDILGRLLSWRRDSAEALTPNETLILRRAIQRFTVRRTKATFNRLIDAEPERYVDKFDRPCRYPEHRPHYYDCGETEADRVIAREIRIVSTRIRGLVNLRHLEITAGQRKEIGDQTYLDMRLNSAHGLAVHQVMACLRSSRAALVEHIIGSAEAYRHFGIPGQKQSPTGDVVGGLQRRLHTLPPSNLTVTLPSWLVDTEEWSQACEREIAAYEEIAQLALKMSDARERTKAAELAKIAKRHPVLLAFDSSLITLADIDARLRRSFAQVTSVIASGADQTGRKRVERLAGLGSTASGVVALCSESMAEGYNLQRASAVVHLDMPSVVRTAEQRVGRVDRLDSPHTTIDAYWPKDTEEFALRADERFFERQKLVSDVLGSNFPVPSSDIVRPDQVVAELDALEHQESTWDGLADAFAPVRGLVQGEQAIVSADIYEPMRTVTAHIYSSVSAVAAEADWAFFAVAGTDWGAPQWVYLASAEGEPTTDLEAIAQALRKRLRPEWHREFDTVAATRLKPFLAKLRQAERLLLPRKKQRALAQMEDVLRYYLRTAERATQRERVAVLRELLDVFTESSGSTVGELAGSDADEDQVDMNSLAEIWIDAIRPLWYTRLQQPRRRAGRSRPLLLRDLRADLISMPLSTDTLSTMLDSLRRLHRVKPLARRVVALIVGISESQAPGTHGAGS